MKRKLTSSRQTPYLHPSESSRDRRYAIAALVLLVVVTIPVNAVGSSPPTENVSAATRRGAELQGPLPEELFEETIRTAYGKLEEQTTQSGTPVRFELANLVTHGEDGFRRLRVIEVATMPEGRLIDVGHEKQSTTFPSGERTFEIRNRAEWRTQKPEWRGNPGNIAGLVLPLDEARILLAQEDPRFADLRAVTTYDVTATLGAESRSYRASFYWFKPSSGGDWDSFDLLVIDHVTQGVEKALRETVPPGDIRLPSLDSDSGPRSSLAPKLACIPGVVASNSFQNQGMGTNSHFVGSHVAGASFNFGCSCDSACGQVCQAGVNVLSCADSGLTSDACHKMGYDTDAQNAVVFGSGASCSSAFRCVQKSCLFCQCGVSVSVSIAGGQVSYSGDTGAWAFQRGWSFTCPTCPVDISVEDPPFGGCGAGVTNTTTAAIGLRSAPESGSLAWVSTTATPGIGARHGSPRVVFPLHRVGTRGNERFIMDEWAVVSDGVVEATSDPAFGQAAVEQGAVPAVGSVLVVQKPVHVMNERHVPEPGVLVNGSGLPRPLRGNGEIVASRIEFGLNGRAESVEILYSSAPVDERAVGQMLRRRVAVSFLGKGRHRAAAYVAVKLTDSLALLSAVSALPQCCCGNEEGYVCV